MDFKILPTISDASSVGGDEMVESSVDATNDCDRLRRPMIHRSRHRRSAPRGVTGAPRGIINPLGEGVLCGCVGVVALVWVCWCDCSYQLCFGGLIADPLLLSAKRIALLTKGLERRLLDNTVSRHDS